MWNRLRIKGYVPDVPWRKVRVVIVCPGIEKLKTVGMLTSKSKLLFNDIAKELYASNGVKLRGMGNLQVWASRGVLLIDPSVPPSKSLTEILTILKRRKGTIHFVLLGKQAGLYAPLLRNTEEDHVLHLISHPSQRSGSFEGSGLFDRLRHIDWMN